jgi:membrane fusion protein (multidrug efflux system)
MESPLNNSSVNKSRILSAIGLLILISLGLVFYWYFFMRGIVSSDDARLGGHLVDLAPEASGTLADVYVPEGARVKKGQKLFQMDPVFLQNALNAAQASLATAKGGLASAKARYERALHGARIEEIKAAEALTDKLTEEEQMAELDFKRMEILFQKGVATQDQLDRAKSKYETALHGRENATQNASLLKKGTRQEDLDAAGAELQTAKGKLAEAQASADKALLNLEHATAYAPFDGWIVRRWLDPGAVISAGRPVLSLFDPHTLHVEANIEEKYLNKITVGDEVSVTVDAFPHLKLKGQVTEILRATNSQFSLIPAEGVSGTFIKVTQRVPLRIAVQIPDDIPLGPGLSVEIKIRIGTARVKS